MYFLYILLSHPQKYWQFHLKSVAKNCLYFFIYSDKKSSRVLTWVRMATPLFNKWQPFSLGGVNCHMRVVLVTAISIVSSFQYACPLHTLAQGLIPIESKSKSLSVSEWMSKWKREPEKNHTKCVFVCSTNNSLVGCVVIGNPTVWWITNTTTVSQTHAVIYTVITSSFCVWIAFAMVDNAIVKISQLGGVNSALRLHTGKYRVNATSFFIL